MLSVKADGLSPGDFLCTDAQPSIPLTGTGMVPRLTLSLVQWFQKA